MPNRQEHVWWGVIAGLGVYATYTYFEKKEINLGHVALSALSGALVATVPDVLEPAKILGPNHRGIAHSLVALAVSTIGTKKVFDSEEFTVEQKYIIGGLTTAFGSHLILDSMTPKGLPLLF